MRSFPTPPSRRSLPPNPFSVSLPPSPLIVSAAAVPFSTFANAVPLIVAIQSPFSYRRQSAATAHRSPQKLSPPVSGKRHPATSLSVQHLDGGHFAFPGYAQTGFDQHQQPTPHKVSGLYESSPGQSVRHRTQQV